MPASLAHHLPLRPMDAGRGPLHYLHAELLDIGREDFGGLLDFLDQGSFDGLWYWDLQNPGNEWMSPGFWTLLGYDWREKAHQASEWQDLIDRDDLRLALDNFTRHCEDPHHPYDQVVRYRHKDGSPVWVRCRGIAIRDADGTPVRMLGVHTDVTALKQTELMLATRTAELEQANEALLQSNVDLDRFAYTVAHDLKSPLRNIAILTRFVAETGGEAIPAEARKHLATLQGRIQFLDRLVADLLAYARSQKREAQAEEIVARDLLEEALGLIEIRPGFRVDVQNESFAFVAPRSALALVLSNLAENAVRHHDRDDGRVILRATRQGEFVQFEVEDDGPGIALAEQARIFDMFYRGRNAHPDDGTGMGLAIVRRMLEVHDGTIDVESEGRGTRFTVRWPRAARAR